MKTKLLAVGLGLVLCVPAVLGQSATQKSFEALKGLAGAWRGRDTLGHEAQITFRVTSNGTALMSELVEPNHERPGKADDMISMIHLDGDRLLLTHYCGAGNQPRLQATASADGQTITFDLVDATNLPSPEAGHMRRVVIRILGPNRHTEEWIYVEHGRESRDLFDMRRSKS